MWASDDDIAGVLSILALPFTMVTGGNDTTTGMLGGSVQLLAPHPEQRGCWSRIPTVIPDSVDEFLRLTSPVQGLARTATRDVTICRPRSRPVAKVLLFYGAGNRDPRAIRARRRRLDVRAGRSGILAFSQGAHHCLGAAAARMQTRVALEELLARMPEHDVDEAGLTWAEGPYVRRPLTLPVTLRAVPSTP